MKKIISILSIFIGVSINYSQSAKPTTSLNYNELAELISDDGNYGSARFNAMSGAFGALGGDLSSVAINPAGGVVSLNSKVSFSLDNSKTNSKSTFLGRKSEDNNFKNNNFNFSNAGGVFVFNSYKSDWNRFALSFNFQVKNDFNSNFAIKANSPFANYFYQNPDEVDDKGNDVFYKKPISQIYDRVTTGKSTRFNLGFSAVKSNSLYLGASLNFHSFEFGEVSKFEEVSKFKKENTNNNNTERILNAFNVQESNYLGNGISLSFGAIYKINKSIRLGLALETPTWYGEIVDESNIFPQKYYGNNSKEFGYNGYTKIETFNKVDDREENVVSFETKNEFETIAYSFKTPTRLTASFAYVFGKNGLISADYTFRNYNGVKYDGGNFDKVNLVFSEYFEDTSEFNIGTEWRLKKWTFRGGYHYKENPNTLGSYNSDTQGVSFGFGYRFKGISVDFSYYQKKSTDYYNIYDKLDTNIDNNTSKITGTLTFDL